MCQTDNYIPRTIFPPVSIFTTAFNVAIISSFLVPFYLLLSAFRTYFQLFSRLFLIKAKNGKPFAYRAFRLFMGWVAGGTRTHDIQNHNLTL